MVKNIYFKIAFIMILLFLYVSINVYATDGFRIRLQEELSVKAGETIEVPLVLDNINLDGVQKGINSFSCTLNYDKSIFELVRFDDDSLFYIGDDLIMYVQNTFNEENNRLVMQFSDSYFNEYGGEYVDKYLEIGRIKLKAKDDAKTGIYNISVTDVEGGNLEKTEYVSNYESKIYVIGIEEGKKEIITEENLLSQKTNEEVSKKEIIVEITQNQNGTELYIKPDIENGIVIGKVMLGNNQLTEKDGVYTAQVDAGYTYTIRLYDCNGEFIGTKVVTIEGKIEELTNSGDVIEDGNTGTDNEPQKDNDEIKKDDNTTKRDDDETKKDDNATKKDDNVVEKDNNATNSNNGSTSNNESNISSNSKNDPVQTGDLLIVPIGIVLVMVSLINILIGYARIKIKE